MTVADLLRRFGPIPASRICSDPPPGEATERDLIHLRGCGDRLYELVDGVLVEKTMGYLESALAVWLCYLLQSYLARHDLGFLAGADGSVRLMPELIRIPDVSFVSWDRLPKREIPADPIPDLAPDLAVEVLSEGNTAQEMRRKLKDYFLAGVRLVWYIDPLTRTVTVYTAPDRPTRLTEDRALSGSDVLPGLELPVRQIFAHTPRGEGLPGRSKPRPTTKPKPRPRQE
jgi:Uma2 family endonuclease